LYGGITLEDTKDQKESQRLDPATVTELGGEGDDSIKRTRTILNSLRRRKYFLIPIGLLFIILFSVGIIALIYTHDQQRIAEGVTISGLKVGNLTQDEAKRIIDKEVNRLLSQTLKLNVGQQSPEVKLEDLGLSVNADLALQEAYDIGRKGSIYDKVLSKRSAKKGVNIDFSQKWDESKLRETLKGTLEKFSNPSTDATFQITKENTMTIKSEHVGLVIDSEALIMKIKEINIYKLVPELKVEFKEQTPLVTAVQLEDQKITGLLASYTTHFEPTQTARSENVRIATKALDMAIIKPGGTLSFNQIVGERTIEGGYKDAFIIVNGEFVPGLAGGICQVSSTLYNTGLFANLSVTQRTNHDLAISYVPLGQDATVAYPDLDLKFNNNSGGYLLLRTRTNSNTLTIEMYGKVKPGQEVFISNTTESIIPAVEQRLVDETMKHGVSVLKQQGQPGYNVKSVRTVKVNGVIVSSEPLKQSHYVALPKIFAVGP
jgi:vancomycin resistance protein YoaR